MIKDSKYIKIKSVNPIYPIINKMNRDFFFLKKLMEINI